MTMLTRGWVMCGSSAQIPDRQLAKELDRLQIRVDLHKLIRLMRQLGNARTEDQERRPAGGLENAGIRGVSWCRLGGLASASCLKDGQCGLDNWRLGIAGHRTPLGDHAHVIGELGNDLA